MPKNKGKGGKNRRRGKNEAEEKRELEFKDDGQGLALHTHIHASHAAFLQAPCTVVLTQLSLCFDPLLLLFVASVCCPALPCACLLAEYAKVLKMLGNGRLDAYCYDGVKRLCHIRGKMRKKVWVGVGDIILVGLRDFQDSKADVILKYVHSLIQLFSRGRVCVCVLTLLFCIYLLSIIRYNADEARNLKTYGELPDTAKIGEGEDDVDADGKDDTAFEFDVDDI